MDLNKVDLGSSAACGCSAYLADGSDAKAELKTAEIARNARGFTFLISCKAKAKEKETARN